MNVVAVHRALLRALRRAQRIRDDLPCVGSLTMRQIIAARRGSERSCGPAHVPGVIEAIEDALRVVSRGRP